MASTTAEKKKINLKTSDEEIFELDEAVAMEMKTIKNIIEDDCADNLIPLPNVKSDTLSRIIQYCKKHVEASSTAAAAASAADEDEKKSSKVSEAELKAWDADFINVGQCILYDLILAANYLNCSGLLDLVCQKVADMMSGKTPDEIRAEFNIKNDFTAEELEEVRKENEWIFE